MPIVREGLACDLHELPQLTEPAQRTIFGQSSAPKFGVYEGASDWS